jgi:hypothetical protein
MKELYPIRKTKKQNIKLKLKTEKLLSAYISAYDVLNSQHIGCIEIFKN